MVLIYILGTAVVGGLEPRFLILHRPLSSAWSTYIKPTLEFIYSNFAVPKALDLK